MSSASSITSPPAKILLSTSTKISLHDRFTKFAKIRPTPARPVSEPQKPTSRNNERRSPPPRATTRNRRLALQMANRPSVQAALKIKNKSIRQRLGQSNNNNNNTSKPNSNSKSGNNSSNTSLTKRLNFSNVSGRDGIDPSRLSGGNRSRSALGRFSSPKGPVAFQRINANTPNRFQMRNRQSNRGGRGAGQIRRVGNGGNIGPKNRFKIGKSPNAVAKNANNSFGRPRFFRRGRGGAQRGGGNTPGRGGKQQAQPKKESKTKEGLDMDLEHYMAKSKSHLDADLDVYMSQTNPS